MDIIFKQINECSNCYHNRPPYSVCDDIGEKTCDRYFPKLLGFTCYGPSPNTELRRKRRAEGLCENTSSTCTKDMIICPVCGNRFCSYHIRHHLSKKVWNPKYLDILDNAD